MRRGDPMLRGYLERVGYDGPVAPTLDCLTAIHRQQALAVPYENLDVQLKVSVGQEPAAIYDKLVGRQRGGWCYELNGLLQQSLERIGFDVRRVAGGVHRHETGDTAVGNHLVLLVQLDRVYIADLGLGDGLREPIPLAAGTYRQGELEFRLGRLDDGYWRLWNHAGGDPEAFDFREDPADEALLAAQCHRLQTAPDSGFVRNLAVQRMTENGLVTVTGRVLAHRTADGTTKRLIGSVEELEATLAEEFGIRGVSMAPAWPRIVARHEEAFGPAADTA
jgi:N-hydroxyarylamine O-acetyltransferase